LLRRSDVTDPETSREAIPPGESASVGHRRLINNYAFQLLNQILRVSAQLILVPLSLSAWGPDLYKDWIVLFATLAFLTMCDFGTGAYFCNRFIAFIARGDRSAFRRELHMALFCSLAIGIVVLLAAYAGLAAYDASGLIEMAAMTPPTVWGCLILMTFPVIFTSYQGVLTTIYRAEGDFAWGECVFGIYLFCLTASVAVVLALKLPPIVAAVCYLVMPTLLTVAIMVDLRRRYADFVLGLRMPRRAELRVIIAPSLLFFTSPLSVALIQSGPIMLFGALAVPTVPVLSYTLVRTVAGLARQTAYQFAVGSSIDMARHLARGEAAACHRLYHVTGQVVTGLVGLFAGFLWWGATPFMSIWTHGTVPNDPVILACFLGGLFLAAPGQAALMLLNYMSRAKPLAAAWCFQAVLGLALAAVLLPSFGVAAAALSLATTEVIAIGLALPMVVQRDFGFSAIRQLTRSFAVGGLAFAWSALIARWIFELELGGLKGLLASACLWAAIVLPPFVLLFLPPRYRRILVSSIRGLAARSA
jgi:hypothetical protein